MNTKRLTWDDIADLYAERTGGRARIQPMDTIRDWALRQADISTDKDGYIVLNQLTEVK